MVRTRLLMQAGPVLVRTLDAHGRFLQELLLNIFAVVQIEFPVDDLPSLGIDIDGMVFAHTVGAISTVLWRVLFGVLCEKVPVLSGGELPQTSTPGITELRISFHGLRVGKVGNRIVSLNGDPAPIVIDRI